MQPTSDATERFRDFLKIRGLSLTRERRRILEAVFGMPQHFSVDDLFVAMRVAGLKSSKATLYRSVQLLVEARVLSETSLSARQAKYELAESGSTHATMVCDHCGRVVEFAGPVVQKFLRGASTIHQFLSLDAKIKISGICQECIRENPLSLRKQVCVPFLKYAQSREGGAA